MHQPAECIEYPNDYQPAAKLADAIVDVGQSSLKGPLLGDRDSGFDVGCRTIQVALRGFDRDHSALFHLPRMQLLAGNLVNTASNSTS